ncbi:MAG: hypothetical protein M3083_25795 [Actinomycetota bacterium]|nr:hypothetical protein [Actinomycetota bacterium]MDQ6948115.1 hypothetical protein [Actinomycetota bacterium]
MFIAIVTLPAATSGLSAVKWKSRSEILMAVGGAPVVVVAVTGGEALAETLAALAPPQALSNIAVTTAADPGSNDFMSGITVDSDERILRRHKKWFCGLQEVNDGAALYGPGPSRDCFVHIFCNGIADAVALGTDFRAAAGFGEAVAAGASGPPFPQILFATARPPRAGRR